MSKVAERSSSYSVCGATALLLQEERKPRANKQAAFSCVAAVDGASGRPEGQLSVPDPAHGESSSVNRSRFPRSLEKSCRRWLAYILEFVQAAFCDVIAISRATSPSRGTKYTQLLSYSILAYLPSFFSLSSPNIRQQLVDLTHHKIHLFFFQQTR